MRKPIRHIYLNMTAAIAGMEMLDVPEITLIEKKFFLCFTSWETVKTYGKNFDTEFEEIDFFRNVKPCFTGQIEYYKILNEAILLCPAHPGLLWPYWNNELGRYARFRDRYSAFVAYYESGNRENDPQYFLTRHYKPEKDPVKFYDTNTAWCTPGDPLVALLQALNLYKEYVAGKLRKLSGDFKRDANTGFIS